MLISLSVELPEAAYVPQLLPGLDDLIQEVIELAGDVFGAGPEQGKPRRQLLYSLLNLFLIAGHFQVLPQLLDAGLHSPELLCLRPSPPPCPVDLRDHSLMQPGDRGHVFGLEDARVSGGGCRSAARLPPADESPEQHREEEGAHVAHRVENAAESVEPVELRLRRHRLAEAERQRLDPRFHQYSVLLLQPRRRSPASRHRSHCLDLAEELRIDLAAFESGHHVVPGGAVVLDPRDAELEHMADLPDARALIHVLVEPLLAGRQPELLHQARELKVGGPEQGDAPLQEL